MKLLILGHSNLVRRRVATALQAIAAPFEIASRTSPDAAFASYDDALARSEAPVVYVSTVNSTHVELAIAALESGRHVVIDKPAALSFADTRMLAELARARGKLIAEATVWSFHPQIAAARAVFADAGSRPEKLVASFSMPPTAAGNYRNFRALGGGALWDLGPYAVSMGRVFFDDAPEEVLGRRVDGGEVDAAFTALLTYADGRSATGHFGMTTAYINRIDVLGPEVAVSIDPAFGSLPDAVSRLHTNVRNERRVIEVPPANAFALFFTAVFDAIARGAHDAFANAMLADAQALERLREACGVISPPAS